MVLRTTLSPLWRAQLLTERMSLFTIGIDGVVDGAGVEVISQRRFLLAQQCFVQRVVSSFSCSIFRASSWFATAVMSLLGIKNLLLQNIKNGVNLSPNTVTKYYDRTLACIVKRVAILLCMLATLTLKYSGCTVIKLIILATMKQKSRWWLLTTKHSK